MGKKWNFLNRERLNRVAREWRKNNPEKARNTVLKKTYGISLTEYNQILLKQNGVCAICKNLANTTAHGKKTLCVDHNHETGKIRGLLCGPCNSGIG